MQRTHPPIPRDMLVPLANLVKSPEKPVWIRRPMKFAEGEKSCTVECRCKAGPTVIDDTIPNLQFITVRAVQWTAKVLGQDGVAARMLVGQCNACENIYWCPDNEWGEFMFLRHAVQNRTLAEPPRIVVPGHRGLVR